MMGTKLRTFAPQINLSLEELVPQDHVYRYLDQKLDLSFVRIEVRPSYAQGGRPSIDPVVFFKLQADLVAIQGNPAWAAQLWGLAEAQREAMGAPISPVERASYERSMTSARAQLGEKAFATVWAEGRTLSPGQAPCSTRTSDTTHPHSAVIIFDNGTSSNILYGLTARRWRCCAW